LTGFALAGVCFLSVHCSEEPSKRATGKLVYEFLTHSETAEITTVNRESVRFGEEFIVNNQRRVVIFEHPNAEVLFPEVGIPKNAVLQFGIGISQKAWDQPGDGVTFEVTVVDQKSNRILIFSRYIDPKNVTDDRKWFDADVDLKDFADQKVSFIFVTTVGPRGNGDADWGGWSGPRIRLREPTG
jgi:hypothetical protein